MRRLGLLGWVVCAACIEKNPGFEDPTDGPSMPPPTFSGTTEVVPTSDPNPNPPGTTEGTTAAETTDPLTTTSTTTVAPTTDMPDTEELPPQFCGNGEVEGAEECDDGNDVDIDGCSNACIAAVCGDGVHQQSEACDDGNQNNEDDCLDSCKQAACGDGLVHQDKEECDDGNADNSDDCTIFCTAPVCGDGLLHPSEPCDDGNKNDADLCNSDCSINAKTIFVTSQQITGMAGGVPMLDALCNELAMQGNAPPGTYHALVSDSMVDAIDHSPPLPVPYVNTLDQVVAFNGQDLFDGNIILPVDRDEHGIVPPPNETCSGRGVHTNTKPDGKKGAGGCGDYKSNAGMAHLGNYKKSDVAWLHDVNCISGCAVPAPIYCVEQ